MFPFLNYWGCTSDSHSSHNLAAWHGPGPDGHSREFAGDASYHHRDTYVSHSSHAVDHRGSGTVDQDNSFCNSSGHAEGVT